MDLHAALVLGAIQQRERLVLAGPSATVHPPDGPLGPAMDRVALEAGLVESRHADVRILAPREVAVGPVPVGMDGVVGFGLDRVPWPTLAAILAKETGRPVRLEGVPPTTISIVIPQRQTGAVLALAAAASGLDVEERGDAVVLSPSAAGVIETPGPAPGDGPWTLAAVLEGPQGGAWFQGPDGSGRSIRLGGFSPTLDIGRLRGIEGVTIVLQTDADETRRVALCGVLPRGTTPWVALPSDEEGLIWPSLRGPLGGDPARDITLRWSGTGPRAEVIVGPELHPGADPEPVSIGLPWALEVLHGVVWADVDADGGEELVVLADWITGVGPRGVVPFGGAAVIDSVQGRVEVRVEDRLAGARDAEDVAEALGVQAAAVEGQPLGGAAGR
jgi:hypothetical protein